MASGGENSFSSSVSASGSDEIRRFRPRITPVSAVVIDALRIRYREIMNKDPPTENTLFEKSGLEFDGNDLMLHGPYCEWLIEYEKNQLNRKRRQRIYSKLSKILNPEGLTTLVEKIPAFYLEKTGELLAFSDIVRVVKDAFPYFDELKVKSLSGRIQKCLDPKSTKEALEDIPRVETDEKLYVSRKTNPEFFPLKYIYKRDCYQVLTRRILMDVLQTVVAVVGDPGTGKSIFLSFLYSLLVLGDLFDADNDDQLPITKVFWQMESGQYRYYDGQEEQEGSGETDVWMKDDVLLLIDGKFQEKHLRKRRMAVVFCSPQHHNYAGFVKSTCEAVYVMPCWSREEVKDFIERNEDVLNATMSNFYDSMWAINHQPGIDERSNNTFNAERKLIINYFIYFINNFKNLM